MPLQWAIVGCGDIANKRVAPAMVEDPGSELVALFSNTPERAEEMAQRFGARRAYSDLAAVLADDRVEAVYLASPPARHLAETVAAAQAGKHVLCEKPMALSVAQCRQMIEACRDNGVALAVSYYRRWYPKSRRIKQLIDEGAIGRPVRARVMIGGRYDPAEDDWKHWRVTEAAGGGALMDTGSHRLDLICYWLGEPARVAGLTGHLAMDYAVPDTETLICEMADGCHLTCACHWNVPVGSDMMEIHGTTASLIATPFDGDTLTLRAPGGETPIDIQPRAHNVHLPLVASFAERVGAGEPPEFDGVDGMQASRIIDAAYRSAESGRWEQA
ncbi:MAG: Gfo/Idh/MocA family protein [Armatimonadota bacterium]